MSKYYLCMGMHVHAIYRNKKKVNKSFDYYRKRIPFYEKLEWVEVPNNEKEPEKVKYGGYRNLATLRAATRLLEDEKEQKTASIYKSWQGFVKHMNKQEIHSDFTYTNICNDTLNHIIKTLTCCELEKYPRRMERKYYG